MSYESFIYQYRKVLSTVEREHDYFYRLAGLREVLSTVERKIDVMACKIGDELNITSSKVTLTNGDLSECNHTSIDLPHDDAIRLRDYLNKVYPISEVTDD